MNSRLRFLALAAASLLAASLAAQAKDDRVGPKDSHLRYADTVAIAAVAKDEDSSIFAEALASAMERELTRAGFRVVLLPGAAGAKDSESLFARAVSIQNSSRWAALACCSIQNNRLVWRASVYDALDDALIASDTQGAFAGLSALPLLELSASTVASQAGQLKDRKVPGKHIEYRLRFSSPDEGAVVSFGSGEGSREAGIVVDGVLIAPFTAFRAGDPLVITLSKAGFWPKTTVFDLGDQDKVQKLPPLMIKTEHSLYLGLGMSRLLGATAGYRTYLVPDGLYLKASDSLWLQYTFTLGSIPVLHDEARIGAGIYIFRPRDAKFRIALDSSVSGIATLILGGSLSDRLYLDAALDPLSISWEWHEPTWAVFLEQRLSYSLGLDSGLINRGWMLPNNLPFLLTLGVMKKW